MATNDHWSFTWPFVSTSAIQNLTVWALQMLKQQTKTLVNMATFRIILL
ncbi:MAG: hypothetical protein IKX51_03005 [Bacteroidales bacterium]|nr:hypothetical protein [Bacteroidales bacterium]